MKGSFFLRSFHKSLSTCSTGALTGGSSEAVRCGEQDNTQTKQGSYKVKAFLLAQ